MISALRVSSLCLKKSFKGAIEHDPRFLPYANTREWAHLHDLKDIKTSRSHEVLVNGLDIVLSELPDDVTVRKVFLVSTQMQNAVAAVRKALASRSLDMKPIQLCRAFVANRNYGQLGRKDYTKMMGLAGEPTRRHVLGTLQGVIDLVAHVEAPNDRWAAVNEPPNWRPHDRILVLHNLDDPGNAGTLIRTAVALGFKEIWSIASPLTRKVITASRGYMLHANLIHHATLQTCREYLQKHGIPSLLADIPRADMHGKQIKLSSAATGLETYRKGPLALWLSSEGQGIAPENAELPRIAVDMAQSVQSLNVAAGAWDNLPTQRLSEVSEQPGPSS